MTRHPALRTREDTEREEHERLAPYATHSDEAMPRVVEDLRLERFQFGEAAMNVADGVDARRRSRQDKPRARRHVPPSQLLQYAEHPPRSSRPRGDKVGGLIVHAASIRLHAQWRVVNSTTTIRLPCQGRAETKLIRAWLPRN